MTLGHAAVKARDASAAVGWFRRALTDQPDDPEAHAWLGQSLCHMGQIAEGAPHLRAAARNWLQAGGLELDRALEVVGQLHQWRDFQGALDLLKTAVDGEPTSGRALQMLAATYGQLNLTADALEAGDRALRLDPGNATTQVLLGSLEVDAGRGAAPG